MIAIVDYRAGNLSSVAAAVGEVGSEFRVTSCAAEIEQADHVIFPGVGAAGAAMAALRELGLMHPLRRVIDRGTPFLGICIGYQMLFERSEEDDTPCLGVAQGHVKRFPAGLVDASGARLKVPQMGWNAVRFLWPHPVWDRVEPGSEFYFVHSYYPVPAPGCVCAVTEYGTEFASGVAWRNVVAFQFHLEKSGRPGLRILDNFCRWDGQFAAPHGA